MVYQQLGSKEGKEESSTSRLIETLHKILEELLAPPTIGAVRFYFMYGFIYLFNRGI